MKNDTNRTIKYAFFFPELREIKIYTRIQDIEDNRIQGTKDIEIARVTITNKYDSKKIMGMLAECEYDLFAFWDSISNVKLKGTFILNIITRKSDML